jgi:hypothetical protein
MAKNVVEGLRGQVDASSQQIAKYLHESGDFELNELQGNIGVDEHVFHWALGWLLQQDAVEVFPEGDSFRVRRKEPDTSKPILI